MKNIYTLQKIKQRQKSSVDPQLDISLKPSRITNGGGSVENSQIYSKFQSRSNLMSQQCSKSKDSDKLRNSFERNPFHKKKSSQKQKQKQKQNQKQKQKENQNQKQKQKQKEKQKQKSKNVRKQSEKKIKYNQRSIQKQKQKSKEFICQDCKWKQMILQKKCKGCGQSAIKIEDREKQVLRSQSECECECECENVCECECGYGYGYECEYKSETEAQIKFKKFLKDMKIHHKQSKQNISQMIENYDKILQKKLNQAHRKWNQLQILQKNIEKPTQKQNHHLLGQDQNKTQHSTIKIQNQFYVQKITELQNQIRKKQNELKRYKDNQILIICDNDSEVKKRINVMHLYEQNKKLKEQMSLFCRENTVLKNKLKEAGLM